MAESAPDTTAVAAGSAPQIAARSTGLVLLVMISVLWGINWPAMKIVLADMSVWSYRSLCVLFGGFGLLAIARIAGQRIALPPTEIKPLLACAIFNITIWHVLTGYGLQHLEAGRASIIAFTMPLWASLSAIPVLGDRVTGRRALGLVLGLCGLAVLMGPDIAAAGRSPLGALFMLGAAMSWGLGTAMMKLWRFSLPTAPLTGWLLLIGGAPICLVALAVDGLPRSWPKLDGEGVFALAYTLIVAMIVCHWAWFKIVSIFPAAVAAIGTLAIPVVGVVSSALWTGEAVGLQEVFALTLVLAGVSSILFGPEIARRRTAAVATGK